MLFDILTSWYVVGSSVMLAFVFLSGYVVARSRYFSQFDMIDPESATLKIPEYNAIGEIMLRTVYSMRLDGRGQPLNLQRMARRFSRHLEKTMAVPEGSVQADVRVIMNDGLYYLCLSEVYFIKGELIFCIPVEWVKEGIQDVESPKEVL